jgi:hypothetical protein
MGYRVALPFGIGASFYDAKQPVKVKDLKLGAFGSPPESAQFVKVNKPITSWQQNVADSMSCFSRFLTYTDWPDTPGETQEDA